MGVSLLVSYNKAKRLTQRLFVYSFCLPHESPLEKSTPQPHSFPHSLKSACRALEMSAHRSLPAQARGGQMGRGVREYFLGGGACQVKKYVACSVDILQILAHHKN